MPSSVSQLVRDPFRAWKGTWSSATLDARLSFLSFSFSGPDGSNLLAARRPTEACWPNPPRHTPLPVGTKLSRPRLNRKPDNQGAEAMERRENNSGSRVCG